jgi:HK97 family phage portal protein
MAIWGFGRRSASKTTDAPEIAAEPRAEHEQPIAAPPGKKSMVLGSTTALGSFLQMAENHATTPSSALHVYEQSSAAMIPITMVADQAAQMIPILQYADGTRDDSHDILKLLKRPDRRFPLQLFTQTLGINYLVTGECGVVAQGQVNRPPLALTPISPASVSISEDGETGEPDRFEISGNTLRGMYIGEDEGADRRYFQDELKEFRQIRQFSTRNNSMLRGQSRLVSAAKEALQNILGGNHNVSLLRDGGKLTLVFAYDADWDQPTFDENQDRILDQYGGPDGKKIGVSSGGDLKIHELGQSARDMDFALLQKMAKEAIALTYKVPLPLITIDATSFNNYTEAKLALFDDAVIPLFQSIYGELGLWLLPRYGLDPREVRITYDLEQVTALTMRRNAELKLRRESNIEALNELRREIAGLDDIEGGDEILVPATMVPVSMVKELAEVEDEEPELTPPGAGEPAPAAEPV